jgi:hypothetical protein
MESGINVIHSQGLEFPESYKALRNSNWFFLPPVYESLVPHHADFKTREIWTCSITCGGNDVSFYICALHVKGHIGSTTGLSRVLTGE